MKNKNLLKIFILTLFFLILIFSIFSFVQAQDTGLVPCTVNCGFNEFLTLINKVTNFFLVYLAIPVIAVMFAYAGFELAISSGDTEKKTKAKKIFFNVIIGLVLVASSWVIINTILKTVGYDGCWIGFGDSCQVAKIPPPPLSPSCVSPKVLDIKTNTCIDEPPLPEPESNILVEGGTVDEEGCPLDINTSAPEPTTFNFLDYLKTQKVLAQENKSREVKVEEAKKIQKDFKVARCWLVNWYENRKIDNTQIQTEFNQVKIEILNKIENTKYRIVDASEDPEKNALAYATNEDLVSYGPGGGVTSFSYQPMIIIRYDSRYTFGVYTFVHELTHLAQIGQSKINETNYIRKEIFPEFFLNNYYNLILNVMNQDDFKALIRDYGCYETYSMGTTDYCYLLTNENGIKKVNLRSTVKAEDGSIIIDTRNNITEISARVMATRKKMGFSPEEEITLNQALELVRQFYQYSSISVGDYFIHTYPIRFQNNWNDLTQLVGLSVNGSYSCKLTELTISGSNVKCNFQTSEELFYTRTFKNQNEIESFIQLLIAQKLQLLLNNTI
jgi:hypothetical protein